MAQRVAGEIYESVTGQLFEIGRQLRQPNGYPFDAQKLQRALQNAIEGKFDVTSVVQQYLVSVNYDLSVKDAIAVGRYDWKNDSIIAKNFPSKRAGTADMEIILVKFDDTMSSEDVLRELDRQRTAFGRMRNYLPSGRNIPMCSANSRWSHLVPCGRTRAATATCRISTGALASASLHLHWFDDDWYSDYRFAAVRK